MIPRTLLTRCGVLRSRSVLLARSLLHDDASIKFEELGAHRSLMIEQFGEPKDQVKLVTRDPKDVLPNVLKSDEVLLEHLVAPINPADINVVQGVYGKKPNLPAVIGNEGVCRVIRTGHSVSHLEPGDHAIVVPKTQNWQSHSVQYANDCFKVDKDLDLTVAAQIKVNPCTAYRMMKDFTTLSSGDTIIQNGANSAVGVYAIQLAKLWGINSINVIRDRPNKDEVINELKSFGADVVLTEAEVGSIDVTKGIIQRYGKPKLLLNCVGGKNAMNCQRLLENGATSITYGAMSKQPFSVTASSLIFKDHRYVGFWVSRWYDQHMADRRNDIIAMLDDICTLFKQGKLVSKNTTLIDFDQRDLAFAGSNNTKYLFMINKR